jgi:hypothetical protein
MEIIIGGLIVDDSEEKPVPASDGVAAGDLKMKRT